MPQNLDDGDVADSELSAELPRAFSLPVADVDYVIVCQFRTAFFFAFESLASALSVPVCVVLGDGSKKQVRWVAADLVVTVVADAQASRYLSVAI